MDFLHVAAYYIDIAVRFRIFPQHGQFVAT
nr:unnamed protein product [Callosobruchus analis]